MTHVVVITCVILGLIVAELMLRGAYWCSATALGARNNRRPRLPPDGRPYVYLAAHKGFGDHHGRYGALADAGEGPHACRRTLTSDGVDRDADGDPPA